MSTRLCVHHLLCLCTPTSTFSAACGPRPTVCAVCIHQLLLRLHFILRARSRFLSVALGFSLLHALCCVIPALLCRLSSAVQRCLRSSCHAFCFDDVLADSPTFRIATPSAWGLCGTDTVFNCGAVPLQRHVFFSKKAKRVSIAGTAR